MPTKIVTGDIWDYPANIRINTVNCVGVMGKGIAKEFKARYPEMFTEYVIQCRDGKLQPGGIHIWKDKTELILNVATKDHWRQPSKYEWISLAINGIKEILEKITMQNKVAKVAMPAMGCSNGGLEFSVVSKMICDVLDSQPHEITVFRPL